ncbi:MAG: ABC transporter permease [Bacilli bacterium]|nr:ABC transporter permease [Bacilli bacterium]MBN2876177.1 ABC transporter permease [Bacilli bacterium]
MDSKLMSYVIKRILLTIVTIWLVITITFFVMNMIPGGPFLSEKAITQEVQDVLNAKYGLDKPLFIQYVNYLKNLLQFDFGPSIKLRGREVVDVILEGFKVSGKIGLMAAGIAMVLGVSFGSIAAINRNKLIDNTIMVSTTAFVAMPSFVIGSFLLLAFCVYWQILPSVGSEPGGLILPVIALALYPTAYITRLTRSSMLDVLQQDYIRTANAKGVSYVLMIYKHALKNALIPVITYAGPMIAYILTGSLVVEKIFSVPGLGRQFINSITNRDYPLIMGTTIFLATLVVLMNLVSDLMYKVVDPRIDFS